MTVAAINQTEVKVLMVIRFLWVIAATLLLVSCSRDASEIDRARAAVRAVLTDPDSAQFQGERVLWLSDGRSLVCGRVNSKNQFGGYAGFRDFHFTFWNDKNYVFVRGAGFLSPTADEDFGGKNTHVVIEMMDCDT